MWDILKGDATIFYISHGIQCISIEDCHRPQRIRHNLSFDYNQTPHKRDKPKPSIGRKRLKIPKGQSEAVNRRRTDNAMAKRKSTKGQRMFYKIQPRKLKILQHKPH